MVEQAYSIELKDNISAIRAHRFSLEGRLNSKNNFRCIDEECLIPLTCTNWKKSDGKRFYFKPSHNDELHIQGCACISAQENKEQVNKEVHKARETISDSGIISVKKSLNKARVNGGKSVASLDTTEHSISSSRINIHRNQVQDRQLSAVATFVELYEDPQINNSFKNIRIEDELISLDEYFVDIKKPLVKDKQRIFYGLAQVSIASFNKKILQIQFIDSDYPNIYSSLEQIQKRSNTRNIADLIDKKPEYIYFRGKLDSQNNKFKSFNDKFYKDLYTPKN